MLFNSIDFALFLPIVFFLYWFVFNKSFKGQNVLLLFSSYIFYGWWDWRFLSLIFFSTIIDYSVGIGLGHYEKEKIRKGLVFLSIIANLTVLVFFKYYNFFIENFVLAFRFFGAYMQPDSLEVVLPVGISFYTFQTLSYSIDVYRKKIRPSSDFVGFATYVTFFPQLVAGPIERASAFLPQFAKAREFNYFNAVDGLRQMLWGFFKKMVIADNCAEYANLIFNNSEDYSGFALFMGAIFFSVQIYGDFSGYSDIAIGTARLFGFNLMQNFAFPYFSRDIAEFWRRWHISLSTWFRDYVYIPLGGSKGGIFVKIRNTFIIFLLSGFWHGANWTFIFWGMLNAIYFLPLLLMKKNRCHLEVVASGKIFPSAKEVLFMGSTFLLSTLAWIFFRAENVGAAFVFIEEMLQGFLAKEGYVQTLNLMYWQIGYTLPIILTCFFGFEWFGRESKYALEKIGLKWPSYLRKGLYILVVLSIVFFANDKTHQFIYFNF